MRYMILIYDEEQTFTKMSPAELGEMMTEYQQFGKELGAKGQIISSSQLQPTSMATSVRIRDGKRLVTDGPFAETREQLGGYFLIEAKDLDEAINIAAKVPSARMGTVEVRPLVPAGAQAGAPATA